MGVFLQEDPWSKAISQALPALVPLGVVGALIRIQLPVVFASSMIAKLICAMSICSFLCRQSLTMHRYACSFDCIALLVTSPCSAAAALLPVSRSPYHLMISAGLWRWGMFFFRVIGFLLYAPQPPLKGGNKFRPQDVTLIIPTIDTDEEAMHEAMRIWVLNQPYEIIIVTVGNEKQKELKRIADTSVACDITRVLQINRAHKRFQLVHGVH